MGTSIGERIKGRRKELNITHVQIQAELGISSGNMSGIENGRNLPSATALIGLSRMLDCSIDWMLKGEYPISRDSSLTDMEQCLLGGFSVLPHDEQYELLEILNIKTRKLRGH